jgi:hypothetical protein
VNAAASTRLARVWLLLSAVSLASWWIGTRQAQQAYALDAAVTTGVILIAALKVRLIVSEFMEARRAPALLRRLADAWLGLLVAALLTIYAVGAGR